MIKSARQIESPRTANVQENKEITHCALQIGHYIAAFLLPFVLFLRAESHLTHLFISSYDFAANVIYESTQGLCVVITILFSSLTFAASSKKAKFFICDSVNRFCAGSSTTFRKNEFVYLFATVVTNADGTIDYNPLEAHTRGTALPDFSSKIKVLRLIYLQDPCNQKAED